MKKIHARQLILKNNSFYGLKKIHTRNLIWIWNSCGSKIPPPPPTFLMVRPWVKVALDHIIEIYVRLSKNNNTKKKSRENEFLLKLPLAGKLD